MGNVLTESVKEIKTENVQNPPPESTEENKEAKKEKFGYDLFPERRGKFTPSLKGILTFRQGKEFTDKHRCEQRVVKAVESCPLVKLMMGALKRNGCQIDLRRHISCEVCDDTVSGGYDPELNQIVICQNQCRGDGLVRSVLIHEMIHMFDYCTNELDFKNADHLACTEVRAANLTHCSFMSSWSQGDSSFMHVKKSHESCVKTKALFSVLAVRKISKEEGMEIIEKVFPKCYADLEPIGRRVRRNSDDMYRAHREGSLYGYDL